MTIITGTADPDYLGGDKVWDAEQQAWVYAETSDEIFGLGGDDSLYGGALSDTLWGGDGDDYMLGEDGGDVLHGEADDDNMGGNAGDDILYGGEGSDHLGGHQGHDTLYGGEGDDFLLGGEGDGAETEGDVVYGGGGDDWMFGNSGVQIMDGGTGTDTAHLFFIGLSAPVEFVALTPGATIIPRVGGAPYGSITGVEIYHNLWGGNGNDRLGAAYVLPSGAGYTLVGGGGEDTAVIDLSGDTGPHSGGSDESTGWTSIGNSNTSGYVSIQAEHIHYTGDALGGIVFGAGDDRLTGLAGNDTFGGGGGDDDIDGAGGDDTLYGGEGEDTITGGDGEDWIDGQTGIDTAVFAGAFAEYGFTAWADRLRVSGPGDEVDQLFGIERLRFADGMVAVLPDFSIDSTTFTLTAGTTIKAEGSDFVFTVSRAGALELPQSIGWSVTGVAGAGTVPAGAADFAGGVLPTGTLSFAAGQATATITVTTAPDSAIEANERFAVALNAAPLSSLILPITAQGVIRNDDARFDIAATSAKKAEGTGSGTTDFSFTVTRSGDSSVAHTVHYAVTGAAGTGTMPADAADFGGVLPSGTVSFAAGQTSRVVNIPVLADSLGELNERFAVTLSAPSGGTTLGTASAQGLITNDDISVGFGGSNVSKPEGNAGSTVFSFTVQRAGALGGTTTVDWSYAPGGVAGTVGTNAADFAGGAVPAGGTLTFAPNQTSQTIAIAVAGDTNPEGGLNESFTLALSNPSGAAALSRTTASGTVRDDDTIYGTSGNDTLTGTAGGDLFVIGRGQDVINGGGGVDGFRFIQAAIGPEATRRFTFNDFEPVVGEKLDLSRIDAIAGTLANDAFTLIGPMPFSGIAGQLRWDQLSPHLVRFQGDVNADSVPDLSLYVFSPVAPGNTWFVL